MVEENGTMAVTSQEGNACAYCRRRKRSCDKQSPRCSACASRNLVCDYSRIAVQNGFFVQQTTTNGWTERQSVLTPSGSVQAFPAVYFLDNRVFQYSRMQLPKTNWAPPTIISQYVGESSSIALRYWDQVHWWMPIISKKRFYAHSLNPLVPNGVDVLLLLAAMKLLMWHPAQEACPVTEHNAIRHALLEAECAGVITIQLLQARILVNIYEIGHAMYPAAYLSVASCARLGMALNVNKCLLATQLSVSPAAALEAEERRRVWWAVLMLDRSMQLGNPAQTLCTEEPASLSYLPSNDEAFESGNITQEPFRANSPASMEMGMLARMCQATFILGRVLRFHSRDSDLEDKALRHAELVQCDRTLRALLNLVYIEGSVMRMPVCAQSGICYSALVALHDPEGKRIDKEHFDMAMNFLEPVANEMTWASGVWYGDRLISVHDASPFLLFWPYRAITIYRRLEIHYGNECQQQKELMEEKLKIMSRRWLGGEAYLQILEARKITRMDSQTHE